jgi:hypothetical protein
MLNEKIAEKLGNRGTKAELNSGMIARMLLALFERKNELFAEIAELTALIEQKGQEYDQITAMIRAAVTHEERGRKV